MKDLSGEEHTDLTSEDQCRDHVDHHGHKRSSIFGKFKDKTKKAGSKIKHNVGKSWSNGDGSTIVVDDDDQGEEEGDATSSTSSSNVCLQFLGSEFGCSHQLFCGNQYTSLKFIVVGLHR